MLKKKHMKLFMEVFKGRPDVVAEYFRSKKTGKGGYSPICKNKWKAGVCRLLSNVLGNGCKKCPSADYEPISESLIKRHLSNGSGNKILGIYPLSKDSTCYFLAADFDNHSGDRNPLVDVKAYYETCRVQDVPCYVLRSKSGTGYHVYIFFSSPIQSSKARIVAYAMLKEAGVIGDDVEQTSFDCLFPKQDKLSGRGFGVPIALPFQGKAAEYGHTLFLNPDTDFTDPYANQDIVLESIEKTDESTLDEIIKDWNLKQEPSISESAEIPISKTDTSKFPKVSHDRVLKCPFIKHCEDDAETLSEPEWWAWITIVARCEKGEEIVHKVSKRYPKYTQQETENKIRHALQDTGPYLCKTIEKINGKYCKTCKYKGLITSPIVLGYGNATGRGSPLVEKDGRLFSIKKYKDGSNKEVAITSFIITPIESIDVPDEGEYLNVLLENGPKVKNIIFPPDCWNSLQKFLKILPSKEFIFTGTSNNVQLVRGHCASFKMPHRKGVRTAGFHDGYFVTEDGALNKDGSTSDLVYMNNVKSDCKLIGIEPLQSQDFSLLKCFNISQVVLLVLGFITACFFKPIINRHFNGFPLLGLFGEAGAGKTSTITRVIMRLWSIIGMPHSISEQSRFSLMKLADSSNSIPLCLEENKACTQDVKQRTMISNFIRSIYNSHEGQRGRPDQTLINYRYQTAVVIAGETGFVEPAIQDRLIVVEMSKKDSSPYLDNFLALQKLPLEQAGRAILKKALSTEKSQVKKSLDRELNLVGDKLTDRPRSNAAIIRFGLRILSEVLNISFDENIGIIDQAIFDGISDDGKERKSAVDMILEKMSLISVPQRGSEDFSRFDHLEEGIHFQRVDFGETNFRLRLHVAKAYPEFKKWAKATFWEGDILPENDFKKQLKNEKYFVDKKSAKIGKKSRNCYIVDINKMKEKGLEISEEWDDSWSNDEE